MGLELLFSIRNYKILSISIFSVLAFLLFIFLISINDLPYIFKNVNLKDFTKYLSLPFQLFLLSSLNFFLSIWIYIQSQKFAKWLILMIYELEILAEKIGKKKN